MRLRHVVLGLTAFADIGHVAFDLDGTLVDSAADLTLAVNHVRDRHGLGPLDPRVVQGYVGDGVHVLLQRTLGAVVGHDVETSAALFVEHYGRHCLDATRLYPGMTGVLDGLRASGRSLSVVTNKPQALAERILLGLGVRSRFLAVVGGDSVPRRKPDPAGLLGAAQRAGIAITQTVLVGDSPIDLATATAAGAAFCGVAWGFDPAGLRDASPGPLARNARELAALLDAATIRRDRRLDSHRGSR